MNLSGSDTEMENYKIDKGLPIPPKSRAGNQCKYPWGKMKKGDSFFAKEPYKNLYGSANAWAKRRENGWVFEARPEKGGGRIWRVK